MASSALAAHDFRTAGPPVRLTLTSTMLRVFLGAAPKFRDNPPAASSFFPPLSGSEEYICAWRIFTTSKAYGRNQRLWFLGFPLQLLIWFLSTANTQANIQTNKPSNRSSCDYTLCCSQLFTTAQVTLCKKNTLKTCGIAQKYSYFIFSSSPPFLKRLCLSSEGARLARILEEDEVDIWGSESRILEAVERASEAAVDLRDLLVPSMPTSRVHI